MAGDRITGLAVQVDIQQGDIERFGLDRPHRLVDTAIGPVWVQPSSARTSSIIIATIVSSSMISTRRPAKHAAICASSL
jgi:hypothetical protein